MARGTVLVAEDDPPILATLAGVLSDAGFHVLEAETGDSALSLFEANDVNLLLTDIAITGPFDGVSLAQRVRQQHPHLPIIFLSGHFDGLAKADGVASPSAFFVKPARLDEIVRTVERLLDEGGGPARQS